MYRRTEKIEILRVIAMTAVVMNHVNLMAMHQFDHSDVLNIAYFSYLFQGLTMSSVAIFFMISGYLMLSHTYVYSQEKLCRSILRYIAIIAVYGTGFAWIELVFNDRMISLMQIPKAFYAMLTGGSWDHLWYLYAYLGLLLVFPVLKFFWEGADRKTKRFIILGGLLITSILPSLELILRFSLPSFEAFCFLFGGYLHELEDNRKYFQKRYFWFGIAISSLVLAGLIYGGLFYQAEWCDNFVSDTSVPMLVLAASIACLCILNDNQNAASDRLLLLSMNSFGVYIYHMFWLNILYKVIKLNPYQYGLLGMLACILASTVGTIVLSVITTMITKKIPIIGKLI